MRYVRLSTFLLPVLLCGPQAWAKPRQPAFLAPGFQFSQVDKVCVMPLIDARKGPPPSPPLNLELLRLDLMDIVQRLGYHLADPSCSAGAGGGSGSSALNARWLLTVRLDVSQLFGSRLTASLFDAKTDTEVWRDNTKPGWGSRFASGMIGNGPSDETFLWWDMYSLLGTFEKRKKAPPVDSGFEDWAPVSVQAEVFEPHGHRHDCGGVVKVNSGVVSFKPDMDGGECGEYGFSVPGNQIKKLGHSLGPGNTNMPQAGFRLFIPGRGFVYFCNGNANRVGLLILAMGGSR